MSLLTPKNRKYRKEHVKSISGTASRGTHVAFGEYGLKAITSAYVTSRQLEAARKVIVRGTKKVGKVWFRVFPNVPLTKLGLEMPMGKGKGDVEQYAARVKRGKVLFEVSGVTKEEAQAFLLSASKKLPVKCRFVEK
jgi:large subunit ribosomal protein L16